MTTVESGVELVGRRKAASAWRAVQARVPRSKPVESMSAAQRVAIGALAMVSALSLWTVVYGVGVSRFEYAHAQSALYGAMRAQLAEETAPLGGYIVPGKPVAVMAIPAIGARNLVVLEGTASGDLQKGPGHERDTPLPGQYGNAVVFGRSGLFGAPFARLSTLRTGDQITVTTGQGTFVYKVEGLRRPGAQYITNLPSSGSRLTFVTSVADGWRSAWAPSGVVYVDAALQGKTAVAPTGRPAGVPLSERVMRGDSSSLYALALWLALLASVMTLGVVAAVRWGRWQAWIAAAPIVAAALWGASECASQLLPNLM